MSIELNQQEQSSASFITVYPTITKNKRERGRLNIPPADDGGAFSGACGVITEEGTNQTATLNPF